MKTNKAIIFDLDGVIVDTAKFHFLAWRKLAQELGCDISEAQNEELKGVSRVDSMRKIMKWGNISCSEEEFTQHLFRKNEDYLTHISDMSQEDLLPGVKEILDYLTEAKIPYALGSASKNARRILKSLDIVDRFVAIVDGNSVSNAKPDPEVFLIAAEKLNKQPDQCVVFEDSLAGIQAANAAGMLSVGIGDAQTLKEADHNFSDFTGISIEFLEELLKE